MTKTVTLPRTLFEEALVFLNVYFLLHEEPSDKFETLMTKLEGYAK